MLRVYGKSLHMLTFGREDWMRIQLALRAQAQDYYKRMTELGERGAYYDVLWQERGIFNHLADKIGETL